MKQCVVYMFGALEYLFYNAPTPLWGMSSLKMRKMRTFLRLQVSEEAEPTHEVKAAEKVALCYFIWDNWT